MAIPQDVIDDVQEMAGDGEVELRWSARRIAARLRSYGYASSPAWIDANAAEFERDKGNLKPRA